MSTGNKFIADFSCEVRCDCCGTRYHRKYTNEIAGKYVCPLCTRYRHMVHLLRFVEFMAGQDCEDVQSSTMPAPQSYTVMTNPQSHCDLDCSCNTCSARKVMRFYSKMTLATV